MATNGCQWLPLYQWQHTFGKQMPVRRWEYISTVLTCPTSWFCATSPRRSLGRRHSTGPQWAVCRREGSPCLFHWGCPQTEGDQGGRLSAQLPLSTQLPSGWQEPRKDGKEREWLAAQVTWYDIITEPTQVIPVAWAIMGGARSPMITKKAMQVPKFSPITLQQYNSVYKVDDHYHIIQNTHLTAVAYFPIFPYTPRAVGNDKSTTWHCDRITHSPRFS